MARSSSRLFRAILPSISNVPLHDLDRLSRAAPRRASRRPGSARPGSGRPPPPTAGDGGNRRGTSGPGPGLRCTRRPAARSRSFFPQFGTDRPRRMPLLIDADHEDEPTVGTGQLAMMAQQRRRHRPGRHDVRLGREGAEHEHAEAEHDHQVDRLAHHARPPDSPANRVSAAGV